MLLICPNLGHWWPRRKGQNQDKNTSALLKMGLWNEHCHSYRQSNLPHGDESGKHPLSTSFYLFGYQIFVLSLCVGTDYCIHPHCQKLQTKIFFTIPAHPLCVMMHARLTPKSLHLSVSALSLFWVTLMGNLLFDFKVRPKWMHTVT